ncbi:DNA-binding protein [Roseovarius gahaiensis]|uniref:DNA-binding protein n=1 Tax=Roseovarius gahaiensis TaxID=2716691 RepID=A0A967BDI3_9RHOB|nr:HU family DNA-binding protein [Roseovarius gahaiensis]NHQ74783.1 DNA-binding protein [Roseovarius gahaiensis]
MSKRKTAPTKAKTSPLKASVSPSTLATASSAPKSSGPKPAKPAATSTPDPAVVNEATPQTAAPELKKKELVDLVTERSDVRKKYAKPVVEAMIDILGEAIAEGRELNLQPFGKIKQQRTKDTPNARITVAKIRQSKSASPALDHGDDATQDNAKESVADAAE